MTSSEDKTPTISNDCSFSQSSNSREIFPATKLYQLLDTLGRGTDSTTYKGLNLVNDQLVTIQIFDKRSPSCISSGQIDMLRRLNHPQLLKLLDILITPQQVWLIFEYCQLGSLNDLTRQVFHDFSEGEIAWICFNILNALEYLQSFSGYQGTLTLSNILINASGQIKMTGFSLANEDCILANLDQSRADFDGTSPSEYLNPLRTEYAKENKLQTPPLTILFGAQEVNELSNCIREILQLSPMDISKELEDFLQICSEKTEEDIIELSELVDHEFLQLYKPEFFAIRKRFSAQALQELEDYRQKLNTVVTRNPTESSAPLEISDETCQFDSQPSFNLTQRLETLGLGQFDTLESVNEDQDGAVMYGDWRESLSTSLFRIKSDSQKDELDVIEEVPDTSKANIETKSLIPSLKKIRRSYWDNKENEDYSNITITEATPIKPINPQEDDSSERRKINESNFVVKHKSHHRASASTNITDSARSSENIETPFAKGPTEYRRFCTSTMHIGDENTGKTKNIPAIHVKGLSATGNESLVCRVLTYTPRDSECKSGRQGCENGLSKERKNINEQVNIKRTKLEVQMSKELQQIQNKYQVKFAELLREEERY